MVHFAHIHCVHVSLQVRYQLLDNTPQKDKAALSQSKGLKDRRLPSHVASLVGDERPTPRSVWYRVVHSSMLLCLYIVCACTCTCVCMCNFVCIQYKS